MNFIDETKLATYLHRANSGVPSWCRHSFYAAKSWILKQFGTQDGRDIQIIEYPCWSCGGEGFIRRFPYRTPDDCWKCNGDGVHHSRKVWLDRWKFGEFVFHCPVDVEVRPEVTPTIRGKIKHEAHPEAACYCADIAYAFNRDALQREVLSFLPSVWSLVENLDGHGAHAIRQWIRDKQAENAAEWKRIIEEKVPSCPF